MPPVRVMADGRGILATPGQLGRTGQPVFPVGGGDTIKLTLDYTLFLGSDTYDSGSWVVNNATQTTTTQSGGIVTSLFVMPTVTIDEFPPSSARAVNPTATAYVGHRLVTTGGRIHNLPVWFMLQPVVGTETVILDGSYLG